MSGTSRPTLGVLTLSLAIAACSAPRPISGDVGRNQMGQSVFRKIEAGTIRFTGGDGSVGQAIVIEGASSESEGIAAEYVYIAKRHPQHEWAERKQMFGCDETRCYDQIEITLKSGEVVSYGFDITAFTPPPGADERPPEIPFSVVHRDGTLHFSATKPFDSVACWRYEAKVWAARCGQASGCSGDFVYGDPSLVPDDGPRPLNEGAFICNVWRGEDGDEGRGVVTFCLNTRAEIGACRRD